MGRVFAQEGVEMNKVCMVVHSVFDDQRIIRYAKWLVEIGIQVDILCLKDRNGGLCKSLDGIRVFRIPLRRFDRNKGNYPLEYGMAFILFSVKLLALFVRYRYQVIHVHNMPDFLIFAASIPKLFGAKLILDIHDPMPEFYMSKYQSRENILSVRILRIQEKLSAAFAQALITANSNFKNQLAERGVTSPKIDVVNNIPDPDIFNRNAYKNSFQNENHRFTLIYPGTIAPRYGLEVPIRALPFLVGKIPRLRLVIIGAQARDAYVKELIALAKMLRVSSYVQFLPLIPGEEIPREIFKADVGIYPALPSPHMNTAVPVKVLEYAAMGIPIVASRLDVLEQLFGDSGIFFFEAGKPEQFADCIDELFHDDARREELVQNADRNFQSKYIWNRDQQIYINLIKRLMM
jgi:glycosyltransferase involved in cell wall biosynthesis